MVCRISKIKQDKERYCAEERRKIFERGRQENMEKVKCKEYMRTIY